MVPHNQQGLVFIFFYDSVDNCFRPSSTVARIWIIGKRGRVCININDAVDSGGNHTMPPKSTFNNPGKIDERYVLEHFDRFFRHEANIVSRAVLAQVVVRV